MARKAFTEHPMFILASHTASDAIISAATLLGCASELDSIEGRANTVADDLTKLLLAAYDKRQRAA